MPASWAMSSTVTPSYPRSANNDIAACWISRAVRSRRCSRSSTPERVPFSVVIRTQVRGVDPSNISKLTVTCARQPRDVRHRGASGGSGEPLVAPLHAMADVGEAGLDERVEVARGEHEELVVDDGLVDDVGDV